MPRADWPLSHCKEQVERKWGKEARHLLGETLYGSLLNSELLLLLAAQDESISADTLMASARTGRSQIIDEVTENGT